MKTEKEKLIEVILETWEKYKYLDNPSLTSTEITLCDDMLDDLQRLITPYE